MGTDTDPAERRNAGTPTAESGDRRSERTTSTLLNGVIGGIVGVVLFFIPFSTVLGGGVAGYLEGGDTMDGATVGAIAGIVAMLPFLLVGGLIALVAPVLVTGAAPRASIAIWFVFAFIIALGAVYVIGLSVVGGIVGVYLNQEL